MFGAVTSCGEPARRAFRASCDYRPAVAAVVHPTAVVESTALGAHCVVREHATVASGAALADDVEIGPGARVLDGVVVHRGASVGANATIRSGVVVGRQAVVEAGAVVEGNVPAYAVVSGVPARIVGYADSLPSPAEPDIRMDSIEGPMSTSVRGVVLQPLTTARDLRGRLAALEFAELPFVPQRVFTVYGVPDESVRGAHAHRACAQFLVCAAGTVSCVADDGRSRQGFHLSGPHIGLHLPAMTWGMQYRFTSDAVLVVLAELPYDPEDYIRDYEEFLELVAAGSAAAAR
jgi:serine acetyltransferase/dTDP-4-dehydrorhamnose 3,5-epimerase-like enzyme